MIIKGPAFADDAMNVPLLVDARGLGQVGGGVARIRVAVDRNPVRQVLDFEPLRALPMLAFRIRMEQASPVRAFVQTKDGSGTWAAPGCRRRAAAAPCPASRAPTVPGARRWARCRRAFSTTCSKAAAACGVRVMHPMDTGLVAGIPAFYIEDLQLVDSSGQAWWKLALHEPVSENPLITFELPPQAVSGLRLVGRDNNGNRIDAECGRMKRLLCVVALAWRAAQAQTAPCHRRHRSPTPLRLNYDLRPRQIAETPG